MARTQRLFYNLSHHFWGIVERKSLSGRRGPFLVAQDDEGSGQIRGENSCVNCSFLLRSFISIFADTVWFLISLLFPVNCSNFNLWSLLFATPIPLSILPEGYREGRGRCKWVAHCLEYLCRNAKFGSTIPKPQDYARKILSIKDQGFIVFVYCMQHFGVWKTKDTFEF